VSRALGLIDRGFLDEQRLPALAASLGVGTRHLTRLFLEHCGAAPGALARCRRVQMAKRLLDETRLPMTDVALASGFHRLRRFNGAFRETYGRPPLQLRRRVPPSAHGDAISLRLYYRPPLDWPSTLKQLSLEAIPGVESTSPAEYCRTVSVDGRAGWLAVSQSDDETALSLSLHLTEYGKLRSVIERVQTMLDLAADPSQIGRVLTPHLPRGVAGDLAGLRLPGAWDGFEVAIRALVQRHAGSERATVVMGDLVARWGQPVSFRGRPSLVTLFPDAARLSRAPLQRCGLSARAERDVQRLSRGVAESRIRFDASVPFAGLVHSLVVEAGFDPSAAEWVAMRALGEPDADLAGWLSLPARQRLWWRATQEALRPWRSYAALLLTRRGPALERSRSNSLRRSTGSVAERRVQKRTHI